MKMTTLIERKRLKDTIIENVSKNVKRIQELYIPTSDGAVKNGVKIGDKSFCKLAEELDHAFLHGLRHITKGYWVVVQEFTHSSVIDDINALHHVITNLGRGRAWLYMALNDNLLESYVQCMVDNRRLLQRYYVKEALVLDHQQLQLLMTLSSGLDLIHFELEVNLPYLDLSAQPVVSSNKFAEDDSISLCSMDSMMSQASSSYTLDASLHTTNSPSTVQHNISNSNNIQSTDSRPRVYGEHIDDEELEVIRVIKPKGYRKKGKRKYKRHSQNNSPTASDIIEDFIGEKTLDSVSVLQTHNSDATRDQDLTLHIDNYVRSDNIEANLVSEKPVVLSRDTPGTISESRPVPVALDVHKSTSFSDLCTHSFRDSHLACIDSLDSVSIGCNNDLDEYDDSPLSITSHVEPKGATVNIDSALLNVNPLIKDGKHNRNCERESILKVQDSHSDESSVQCNNVGHIDRDVDAVVISPFVVHEDNFTELPLSSLTTKSPSSAKSNKVVRNQDSFEIIDDSIIYQTQKMLPDGTHSAEIIVKPNELLLLMLNVFTQNDENFNKMFHTSLYNKDGERQTAFLLITSACVYILTNQTSTKKPWKTEAVIRLEELDYIAIGLDDQTINIVCKNRRRHFWIITADSELTHTISSSVYLAISQCDAELCPLTVIPDASVQKITLNKCIQAECNTQDTMLDLGCYSIVYWQQLDFRSLSSSDSHVTMEGVLWIKSHNNLLYSKWKQAYFVQRNNSLYEYAMRKDLSKPVRCIKLSAGHCSGCRLSQQPDKKNCFEILSPDGKDMLLASDSEQTTHSWVMSICLAVSKGVQRESPDQVTSCSAVVTSQNLMLCYEDLDSNFFRKLEMSDIADITHLSTTNKNHTYTVLSLDCTSNLWIFYFTTEKERSRFNQAIYDAWFSLLEGPLTSIELPAQVVQKCETVSKRLAKPPRWLYV